MIQVTFKKAAGLGVFLVGYYTLMWYSEVARSESEPSDSWTLIYFGLMFLVLIPAYFYQLWETRRTIAHGEVAATLGMTFVKGFSTLQLPFLSMQHRIPPRNVIHGETGGREAALFEFFGGFGGGKTLSDRCGVQIRRPTFSAIRPAARNGLR